MSNKMRKKCININVFLLGIHLFFLFGCSNDKASNDVVKVDWLELYRSSEIALKNEEYDKFDIYENIIIDDDNEKDLNYLMLSLNCVAAKKLGNRGDTYFILNKVNEELRDINEYSERYYDVLYKIAEEFKLINLPYRSYKILSLIPEKYMTDERKALMELNSKMLGIALNKKQGEALEDNVNFYGVYRFDDKDMLRARLKRLLVIPTYNPWYDIEEIASLATQKNQEKYEYDINIDSLIFNPFDVPTDKYIKRYNDLYRVNKVKNVIIDELQKQRLSDIISTVINKGVDDVDLLVNFARDVLPNHINNENLLFEWIKRSKSTIVLTLCSGDCENPRNADRHISVIFSIKDKDNPYVCYKEYLFNDPYVKFIDLTADGTEEVVFQVSEGSGSYLYCEIIDPKKGRNIFSVDGVSRGNIASLELDGEEGLELVLRYALMSMGYKGCNQCPRIYESIIFKYDKEKGKYAAHSSLQSTNELLYGFNPNPMGLSARMVKVVIDWEDSFKKISNKVINSNNINISGNLLSDFVNSFLNYDEYVYDTKRYHDAISVTEPIIKSLRKKELNDEWRYVLLGLQESLIGYCYYNDQFDKCLNLLNQEWYKKYINNDLYKMFVGRYYSILNSVYLRLGYLGKAYDAIMYGVDNGLDSTGIFQGNLSIYYSYVNDYQNSYRTSMKALDKSLIYANYLKSANQTSFYSNIYINMFNAASAALKLNKDNESIDWLTRSIDKVNYMTSRAMGLFIYKVAADIAIKNKYYDLASMFLNNSIITSSEESWALHGADIYLLYAKLLEEIGYNKISKKYLVASAKLSNALGGSTNSQCNYMLSKLAYKNNDIQSAWKYARECFENIASNRRIIQEENHKFSFLADKEEMVKWYFTLSIKCDKAIKDIYKDVEKWKLQSFFDVYADKVENNNKSFEGVTAIKDLISENEIFLEYVISEKYQSFVISYSGADGFTLTEIPVKTTDLKIAVTNLRECFDIRNAKSLRDIRSKHISKELKDNLNYLYKALIEPIKIKSNIKRIVLSSDKVIYGIPWKAIIMNNDKYLIEKYDIVNVPSAKVVMNLARNSMKINNIDKRLLILAALSEININDINDNLYNKSLSKDLLNMKLSALSNGKAEVMKILKSKSFDAVTCLLDKNTKEQINIPNSYLATPSNLLHNMKKASAVHIISHGIYNSKNPMKSALFLQDRNGNNKLLYANNFLSNNYGNVDIITLASCQTGISSINPGSEPIGFIRSLMASNVKSMILMEWEVDDNTTSEIFNSFYKNYSSRKKSEILRQSQINIIKKYKHPYYWAGMKFYGYWK